MGIQLTSSVFEDGGDLPIDYTCNGRNVSPPLTISNVPEGVASLVLIFDDPDAAKEPAGNGTTFDHWTVFNILPADQKIAEDSIPSGGELGRNSRGTIAYIGPCPPTFRHQYVFRLLALDCKLNLSKQPTKSEVQETIKGHIVEEARLVSYYEQPEK